MRLLLLSGSKTHEKPGFLEHALPWLKDHFANVKTILFIPYALQDHDAYAEAISAAFAKINIKIISAHTSDNPVALLDQVDGVYIGGGNTFRLLNMLYKTGLIHAIPEKVRNGMPYASASAGTNVACPTIRTTNDMPIVEPPSLTAMGLTNFQINPHYLDPIANSTHMGETREQRIKEFHEENSMPVLGLREGTALKITDKQIILLGDKSARLFRQGQKPIEIVPNSDMAKDFSLSAHKTHDSWWYRNRNVLSITAFAAATTGLFALKLALGKNAAISENVTRGFIR
jgi:dipeptidase E